MVIGKMTAFTISPALFFNDEISCREAFDNAKQNDEVLYIVVQKYDQENLKNPVYFTSFNNELATKCKYKEISADIKANVIKSSVPILHNNKVIGILYIGLSLKNVKQELYELKITIGIISLIILIIGTILTYVISAFVAKPLNEFVETIKEISYRNMDRRVNITSSDEVGQLASTFNKMIDELQYAYSSIASMNKNLERRVIERTQDLEQSRERFKVLYNETPVMLYSVDREEVLVSVSDFWLENLGYTREEVIGTKLNNFLTTESIDFRTNTVWPAFLQEGRLVDIPLQMNKKNGEVIDVLLSATSVRDSDGNIVRSLSVLQDVTEKKKVLNDLIVAKEKAEISDKFKSDFLAQMSHEIRSPLNVIFSFARFIKDELAGTNNPVFEESFNALELAGNRIMRTINMILDMSEIQTGSYQPEFNEIDLHKEILTVICNQYKIEADRKGLVINLISKIPDSPINADEYSITQIFANLLDNAIKYTKKGKIDIVLDYNENHNLRVSVIDTGIGISKEYIPNLFKPFTQEEQGYTRRYEGNGLGLALIEKYCALNHGSISVESEKDKGSKFTVVFS
jgi:PAS domain S-box-containing protein